MTRFGYVVVTHFSVVAISVLNWIPVTPKLIWNASASVPIGLYALQSAERFEVTELVAVMPPEPLAKFLDERGYLARHVPLMKRIAALSGQKVCRTDNTITVDGIAMGEALDRDHLGRDLPVWSGCRTIADGEVFLMNWQSSDSLDSRYFGPLPARSIIGRAVPLWTETDEAGAFEWHLF
ncbi:MAG: S26 family signal peptidase [Ancalomicrobiaceae bacterium]|nr:S26 family signal peptidase [Ancalomicrobiaceae bacterium]